MYVLPGQLGLALICDQAEPPDVSDLGWISNYSGNATLAGILSHLKNQDVRVRYLSSEDGQAIQEISDHLVRLIAHLRPSYTHYVQAATELWPMRSTLYPQGYGQRVCRRMLKSQSPAVVVYDCKTGTILGWSNFLNWGYWSTSIVTWVELLTLT